MGKIVVGFPLYRQVSTNWFSNWICMDTGPVVGKVVVDGTLLPKAVELLVKMAFEHYPEWDRLVFFEHDVIPPLDAFNRIAEYQDEHDIVAGMTFMHEPPHHIMAGVQVDGGFAPLTAELTKAMVEQPALYEVDTVPMGFTSIARRVFEQWNPQVPMWCRDSRLIGHDLHFCIEAKKQGFKVWLDSGIKCGHLTLLPIGYEDQQHGLAHPPTTVPLVTVDGEVIWKSVEVAT